MALLLSQYKHFILMGDFYLDPYEDFVSDFMELYNFKNLVKLPTGFNFYLCMNILF